MPSSKNTSETPKVEPEKLKELLKRAAKIARRNTRKKGYGHGIFQRVDKPDLLSVAPLKYGKNDRFEWRRIGKVNPKNSQPSNSKQQNK